MQVSHYIASTPLDSHPVSSEGVMDYPDRVSSSAFVHPTPMQAGGSAAVGATGNS